MNPYLRLCVAVTLFTALSFSAQAQGYQTSVGVRLSPTAPTINNSLSFKHFISKDGAIEGLISLGNPYGVGALYEIHQPLAADGLQWYFGGGGYVGSFEKRARVGAAGVVGLDYVFPSAPINISIDWKPELNMVPELFFEPAAFGFTVRFVLGKGKNGMSEGE
ncbi:MAG: hypothetical protein ACO1NW_08685 [Chitinophagaceae bacterium]